MEQNNFSLKNIWVWIVIILVIVLILVFGNNANKNEIKIGMILPLTGTAAQYGEQLKDGAQIAESELKNTGANVKIFYEDSAADPTTGLSAYRRLVDVDKVDYIVSAMTRSTLPLLDSLNKDKIPMIMTLVAGDWDKTKTKYALRFYPTARQYVRGDNSDKILNGLKSVGVINVNDAYGQSVVKEVQTFAKEKGFTVGMVESYSANNTDYRSSLLKLKNSGVDSILMISSSPVELSGIAKQYKELNIKQKLFDASVGLSNPIIREQNKDILEGVVTKATKAELTNKDKSAQDFFDKYEKLYNSEPYFPGIFGYESIRLINDFNSQNGSDFVEKASNLKSISTIMGDIKIDNYQEINPPIYNTVIRNGELVEF